MPLADEVDDLGVATGGRGGFLVGGPAFCSLRDRSFSASAAIRALSEGPEGSAALASGSVSSRATGLRGRDGATRVGAPLPLPESLEAPTQRILLATTEIDIRCVGSSR